MQSFKECKVSLADGIYTSLWSLTHCQLGISINTLIRREHTYLSRLCNHVHPKCLANLRNLVCSIFISVVIGTLLLRKHLDNLNDLNKTVFKSKLLPASFQTYTYFWLQLLQELDQCRRVPDLAPLDVVDLDLVLRGLPEQDRRRDEFVLVVCGDLLVDGVRGAAGVAVLDRDEDVVVGFRTREEGGQHGEEVVVFVERDAVLPFRAIVWPQVSSDLLGYLKAHIQWRCPCPCLCSIE